MHALPRSPRARLGRAVVALSVIAVAAAAAPASAATGHAPASPVTGAAATSATPSGDTPVRDATGITVKDFSGHARHLPAPKQPLAPQTAAARTHASAAQALAADLTAAVYYIQDTAGAQTVHELVGGTTPGATKVVTPGNSMAWSFDGSRLFLNSGGVLRSYTSLADTQPVTLPGTSAAGLAVHPSGWEVARYGAGAYNFAKSDGYGSGSLPVSLTDVRSATYTGDGQHLVVTDTRAGRDELYTLDLTTDPVSVTRLVPDDASAAATQQRDAVLSPDRSRLAYVQTDDLGVSSVWVSDDDGTGATHVADATVADRGLAWTRDGQNLYLLAVDTTNRLQYVPAVADSTPVTLVDNLAGTVRDLAARPTSYPITPARAAGTDRIDTAVKISQGGFNDKPSGTPNCDVGDAESVILARSDVFADGLSASPLSAAKCGPLLITPPSTLDPRVRTEIKRVLKPGARVYVIGSTAAISASTVTTLTGDGFVVTRYSGKDRYATAAAVAISGLGHPTFVVIADGTNFPDALVAGPAAAANGGAVLLSQGSYAQASTNSYITTYQPSGVMIGRPAATAYQGSSIVGTDRYDTAVRTAQALLGTPRSSMLAYGLNFPDALSGGAYASHTYNPLFITPTSALPAGTATMLDRGSAATSFVYLFGSTAVVSANVANQAVTLARGRESYLVP